MQQWLICPDIHVPFHDEKYLKTLFAVMKDHRFTGVVQLGDFVDFFQISSYDKDPNRINSVTDDLSVYSQILDIFEKFLPKGAVFHQLGGNHEARLKRYVWQRAPHIANLIRSIPEMLEFPERNKRGKVKFIYHDYENWKSCRVGDCYMVHGFYYNQHVAATMLAKYQAKIICGHTHRIQYVQNGALFAATLGHASNEHETAHQPTPTGWAQAFGILTVVNGKSSLQIVPVDGDGACVFQGKSYG